MELINIVGDIFILVLGHKKKKLCVSRQLASVFEIMTG